MKIIIFGLGNFGSALALYMTESGNEVIGIDKDMNKVEHIKDKIAYAIGMDSTNELAYDDLPIRDADIAVVAIGENEGAAIITTAILKRYLHLHIISRSLSPIHDTVLQAMEVQQIIHPEQEAAERLTRKLNLKKAIDNYIVDEHYSISEIRVPQGMVGKTILELRFREKFDLNIITILRERERANFIGRKTVQRESIGLPRPDTALQAGDVLVVFGSNRSLNDFCSDQSIPEK